MFRNTNFTFQGFIVGAYLFSVPVFSYTSKLGLNNIPQYIGILITIYAFYYFLKTRSLNKNSFLLFYLIFTIWSIVSYTYADNHSQPEALKTLIKVTIITISAGLLIKHKSDFILCLSFFFISIFLAVWLNLDDILNLKNSYFLTDEERFAGTFANANTAAMYGIAIIWTGMFLLFNEKKNILIKFIIIVGIIVAGFLIIYSGSRKGLIGLGFLTISMAWIFIKKHGYTLFRKFTLTVISLAVVSAIFIIIYTSPFFSRIETMFQGESSFDTRLYLLKEALYVWKSSLKNTIIGIGIDNFRFYNTMMTYSHSTVSEILVSTGIIGFILYFSCFIIIFSIFGNLYKILEQGEKIIILIIFVFLILVLFFNSAAVMYDDRLYLPLLGVISSYGLVLKSSDLSLD